MKRIRFTAFSATACLALVTSAPLLAAEQIATAPGQCGVAINASGQAQVIVNNFCDTKTAATVQRLLDKTDKADRTNRQQDQKLHKLEVDREAQARQIKELFAAVQTVNRAAAAPAALPADKRAADLLAQGNATGAIALLGREAEDAAGSATASRRKAAELYRQQAALLRTQDVSEALKALEHSLAAEPDHFDTLWDAGDLAMLVGNTESAKRYYSIMVEVATQALKSSPGDTEWQRNLSASHHKIGDIQAAQGDSPAALESYKAGLAIHERLAASDPRNTQWQRDLSVSHNQIGDVQAAQGDSSTALKSYQAGLAIRERLTAGDPSNTQWRRDLSVSYLNIASLGNIAGSVGARRVLLQKGLAILIRQHEHDQLPQPNVGWIEHFKSAIDALK